MSALVGLKFYTDTSTVGRLLSTGDGKFWVIIALIIALIIVCIIGGVSYLRAPS